MNAKQSLPIARDAFRFFIPPILLGFAAIGLQYWLDLPAMRFVALALFALSFFVLWFFRDPERRAPKIEGCVVSPADGRVTAIEEVEHPGFPGGRAKMVSVFLSIFNVHVNRAPIQGEIGAIEYHPGKFINAMNDKSSAENEHNSIEFMNHRCKVYVKQIAGLIARRIVCSCRSGERIGQSDRIGLIRFGSRVDTFLPLDAEIRIKKGMSVRGGESVLAVIRPAERGSVEQQKPPVSG